MAKVFVSGLVSVITPAFNASKYISEMIRSLQVQTYPHWELLLIDDGSTDSTVDIVRQLIDHRITLICQSNRGVSSARNAGLDRVSGEFITFVDSDDYLPPDSLKARVLYLQANPEVDLVDGQIAFFHDSTRNISRLHLPASQVSFLQSLATLDSSVFAGPFYMFRTSLLGAVRFDISLTHCEDILFYLDLACASNVNYSYVSNIVYMYRIGHSSAMTQWAKMNTCLVQLSRAIQSRRQISLVSKISSKFKIAKIVFLQGLAIRRPLRALVQSCSVLLTL